MTLCINFYGGPSAGKSSMAMGVASYLKFNGFNAEYISEYMKGAAWENRTSLGNCQEYIFGKQHFSMQRVRDKVDVLICDSPLLLTDIYAENYYLPSLNKLAYEAYCSYDNVDIFVNRVKPYSEAGRFQKEHEAILIDARIKKLLISYMGEGNFEIFDGTIANVEVVSKLIIDKLAKEGISSYS